MPKHREVGGTKATADSAEFTTPEGVVATAPGGELCLAVAERTMGSDPIVPDPIVPEAKQTGANNATPGVTVGTVYDIRILKSGANTVKLKDSATVLYDLANGNGEPAGSFHAVFRQL